MYTCLSVFKQDHGGICTLLLLIQNLLMIASSDVYFLLILSYTYSAYFMPRPAKTGPLIP